MKLLLGALASYLLGSIPTSLLVARVFGGVDLRTYGSKNLGATNLYRLLGFKAAVPAGLFDVFKGTLPVMLAMTLDARLEIALLMGACAVLGHVFSPFAGFKGGKGVATAAGVFLAIAPWSILVALGVFVLVVKLSGYVSLGSMIAAAVFAGSVPLFYPGSWLRIIAAVAVCGFIVFTHRANIGRLMAGTENRFGGSRDRGTGGPEKTETAR